MNITEGELLENLKTVFINQDKYYFDKHVPEFLHNDVFLGDCFSMIMVEPKHPMPPRFYHTFSPFDTISHKAPDQALVFEDGELLLNTSFAEYVVMRTGAMDTLLLQTLGVTLLKNKKILYIGSGKITQASLKILKSQYDDVSQIDCINNSSDFDALKKVAHELDIETQIGDLKNINEYDFIFCHTSANKPLLTSEMLNQIKQGAVITTFISSTEHGEVSDEYFDSSKANIICDWQKTLVGAKDLGRAVLNKKVLEENIIFLKDLLNETKSIDNSKHYTIYRSVGTPLQNLAVLQLLVGDTQSSK